MKDSIFHLLVPSLLLVATSAPTWAQGPGKAKGKALPIQGKPLPDVSAIDENGDSFPLRKKLKGRHAVIVFGCLT